MTVTPEPSKDEIDRQHDRKVRFLVGRGKANRVVRYHAGAEAAADAAGIP